MKNTKNKGFTLIEILVVIGIIAVLAAIVLVAINPAKRFRDANNAQRQANVGTILNALGQKIVDGKGSLGCTLTNLPVSDDPAASVAIGTDAANVNLQTCLSSYLTKIPVDPDGGTDVNTKYTIEQRTAAGGGGFTVCAPETKDDSNVSKGKVAEVCVTR